MVIYANDALSPYVEVTLNILNRGRGRNHSTRTQACTVETGNRNISWTFWVLCATKPQAKKEVAELYRRKMIPIATALPQGVHGRIMFEIWRLCWDTF